MKLYNIIGGEKFIEDKKSGNVNVASLNQQFAVKLDAFPTELEGGGTVYFTVKVWNFANQAVSLNGFVEDESGAVVKSIDGFEGRIPANARNYTLTSFSLNVYGVDNHTFRLFLDNYDGKPNGAGEEHWNEVRVEVKPVGNVIATMDCNPSIVPLDDSTTCTVHIELKSADMVMLNLKEVDFGGKKIWPNSPSSVTVNKQTVTLTPTNMQEDLTITIDINDELADYYFEKSPWLSTGSYKDRFAGYSYLVKAIFNGEIIASDIFEITNKPPSTGEKVETTVKVAGIASSVLQKVSEHAGQLETVASGTLGKIASISSKALGVIGWFLTARDVINWLRAPTPSDGDNNTVIGG